MDDEKARVGALLYALRRSTGGKISAYGKFPAIEYKDGRFLLFVADLEFAKSHPSWRMRYYEPMIWDWLQLEDESEPLPSAFADVLRNIYGQRTMMDRIWHYDEIEYLPMRVRITLGYLPIQMLYVYVWREYGDALKGVIDAAFRMPAELSDDDRKGEG